MPEDTDATTTAAALCRAAELADQIQRLSAARETLQSLIAKAQLQENRIRVAVQLTPLLRRIGIKRKAQQTEIWLETPAMKVRMGKATKPVISDDAGMTIKADEGLLALLREARDARDAILGSPDLCISAIAAQRQRCRHRLAKLLKLSWLAPDIVDAITSGRHPNHLTPKRPLAMDLKMNWRDQASQLQIL